MDLVDLPYPEPIIPAPQFNTLDSTKINCFQTCPRRFFYKYILGWSSDRPNIHLVFGSAWHEAMEIFHMALRAGKVQAVETPQLMAEVFRERFAEELDPDAGIYKKKEPAEGLRAINDYWERYKFLDDFDVLHIEVPGDIPITEDWNLTVKIDTICEDDRGVFVLEHKTLSADSEAWSAQWLTAIQPKAYNHALYCVYGESKHIYGTIINGVVLKKDIGFVRVTVSDVPGAMEEWLWEMEYKIKEIEHSCQALCECTKDDHIMQAFPKRETSCTDYMRPCEFQPFCCAWRNPLAECHRLPIGTVIKHWDPKEEFADKPEKFEGGEIVKTTVEVEA